VAGIELGRYQQFDRHRILVELRQRQRQRGGVVDVLDLQLLLQIGARRQHVDHQTAAKGQRQHQHDGQPELFDK